MLVTNKLKLGLSVSVAAGTITPTVAAQQARAKGFALDLSMGGPDSEDADFRESA